MQNVTSQNFGLLIAYILPGFTVLAGIRPHVGVVGQWMGNQSDAPTVSGFLYVTVASIAVGLFVSTIRWLLLDSLHHRTGITPPAWDMGKLPNAIAAFNRVVEDQYRYYQFYGNELVALTIAAPAWWLKHGADLWQLGLFVIVAAVLFAGSRDTLHKFYQRVAAILAP